MQHLIPNNLFERTEWEALVASTAKVTNVSSVPQLSPFRYPGGKTWFVPTARKWLASLDTSSTLVEPFCGGGIIGLTAAFESWVDKVLMAEKDPCVAAVWHTILGNDYQWLSDQIGSIDITPDSIQQLGKAESRSTRDLALSTIVRNRTSHGGILAKGSGMIKNGDGKGLKSRWYPQTIQRRIKNIHQHSDRICFRQYDALQLLEELKNDGRCAFFIDPPYTAAGKRLYTFHDINHEQLFELVAQLKGHFLMTYDLCDKVRWLADCFRMEWTTIPMQTTHLVEKREIIISDNLAWFIEKSPTYKPREVAIC